MLNDRQMACHQTVSIRLRCRMTLLTVFFISLELNATLSSAREVNKMASPRPSLTAAEFLMNYFIPEELPPDTLVGNVVVDFGLDLKYEPDALGRLHFDFLQPSVTSSAEWHAWTRPDRSSESDVRDHGWQPRHQPQRREHHETSANGRPPWMAVSGLELFSIDERTGIIRTRIRIDRERVCPSSSTSFVMAATYRMSGSDVCTFKLDIAVILPADIDSAIGGSGDGNVASHVQVLGVRVEILDINDHTPTFPNRKWMYQMSEAAEPGTEFVVPSAIDLDGNSRGNGIRLYSLDHTPIDGVDKFDLKVVQQVGRGGGGGAGGFRQPSVVQAAASELGPHHVLKLVLRENLDRERTSSHIVVVSAVDGGSPPRTGSMIIVVEVIDANDNRPEFNQQTYEVWVKESTPPTSVILTVTATDRDMGFNGRVVYSLAPLVGSLPPSHPVFPASPNDALSQQTAVENQLFGIGPETGRIYIKQPLDFETMTAFALTVTASDLGPDSLSSHASIIVHVEDVNDNRPTITVTSLFQQPNIAGGSSNDPGVIASHRRDETSVRPEVAEDAAIGTFVAHLSVTDVDSGRNGNVRCSLAERDVAEGLAASGHGVATVAGSSSPLSDLTAGSGGGDRPAAFDLVRLYGGTEYKLVTAARLDRETRSQYRLTISCCDDGWPLPATSSVHLTVVVTDRNDCAPTFDSATYAAAIYENVEAGRTIVRVRATDCDDAGPNSRVSYRLDPLTPLSADVGRYVQVDKESGLVTLRESLDRERYEQLLFDIVAEDAGSPPLTGRATVRLVVLDRDDQGPVFETDEYRFEVVENHPIGTVVGVVRAIDGDLPPFDRITYEIVSDAYIDAIGLRGSNSSTTESLRLPFSIDADSGKLTTLEVLDREVASMYRFQVKARSDDSIGVIGDDEAVSSSSELRRPVALVATASVIVNVGDVNDNRPKFTFPDRLSTSSVLKTRGERNGGSSMPAAATAVIQLTGIPMAGQIVAKLHAFDPDSQANARPHFGLAAISAESATSSAVNVGNQHHRLQDFDVDPFTGLITVGPGIQRPLSLSASPFGDDKVIRRTLEVTVSDAAEPEVVSDRAILEIVLQTDNAVESEDTSKSRQDAIGSGDGSGIVSAIHDVTLVGHGVGLLASERLVLVLSCLLCVVLLAVAASVIALCAVRSSVTPLEGAAIDSASRQSGSMTVALAARCRSLSTCVVNDADKRFVNGFQTTAAHGFHLRGATADPADV